MLKCVALFPIGPHKTNRPSPTVIVKVQAPAAVMSQCKIQMTSTNFCLVVWKAFIGSLYWIFKRVDVEIYP